MWRVAKSLDVLLAEVNAAAPNRSKVSDGSIGDAAHASRSSDHNPWRQAGGQGVVGARDFTHDPAHGCDASKIANAVAGILGKHPALKSGAYVIWNRRIISADRIGEGWRAYTGSNGHTQHVHVSVATAVGGFDSTQPWGVMGGKAPTPTPNALARPSWRGRTNVDAITIAAVEYAETLRPKPGPFTVTQGSYQSSVAASAGTHDKGGAVDLRWTGDDGDVLALRKAGFAAWHRTPAQGPWPDHIHAVLVGHPLLAPSAARQVDSYRAGRNGLANNGADDGPRLNPIPTFTWPPKEDELMAAADDIIANDNRNAERILARVQGLEERARDRDNRQHERTLAAINADAEPAEGETVEQLRARLAKVRERVADLRALVAEGEAGTPGEALAG